MESSETFLKIFSKIILILEDNVALFSDIKVMNTVKLAAPLLEKLLHLLWKLVHVTSIHSSVVCNSKKLETTQYPKTG